MHLLESLLLIPSFVLAETELLEEKPHFEESSLLFIKNSSDLDSFAKFENLIKKDNKILLRSTTGEGSIVHITENITTDSWAVEFQVKNHFLHDIEKTGMYLWYTDKELTSGTYLGGNSTFNGFVTGIEFSKDRADLVFAHNFGHDFKNKETQTIRYDHINPALIDNLDNLIIKVIHTEMNFKIEIYDQDRNLISDTFRIIEPFVMHKDLSRKFFSITTKYDHCANDIQFDLKNFKISSRKESENYDHIHINTEHNQYPRNKGDHELRIAIAEIAHFMNYLVLVLGTKGNNNILDMTMDAKKKMRMLHSSIENLIEDSRKQTNDDHLEQSLRGKIEDLERTLANNLERIEMMKEKFNRKEKKSGIDIKGVVLCASLAGLILIISLMIKDTLVEFASKTELGKKE